MPQLKDFVSVAANSTIANVVSGSPFERVGGLGARVKLFGGAVSGNPGDLLVDFLLGSDVVAQNAGQGVAATGPRVPDDSIGDGDGLPGDQITVRVQNTTAGAIVWGFLIDIESA
jgi:hypothetical protein